MKYKPHVVDRICELIAAGNHSVKDVCKQAGITIETYSQWKKEKADFSDRLKEAEIQYMDSLKIMSRSGMAKLLDVYEFEEVSAEWKNVPRKEKRKNEQGETVEHIVWEQKKIAEKRTRKHVMPNPTMIIFVQTNTDPENFKHRNETKVKIKGEVKHTPPSKIVIK